MIDNLTKYSKVHKWRISVYIPYLLSPNDVCFQCDLRDLSTYPLRVNMFFKNEQHYQCCWKQKANTLYLLWFHEQHFTCTYTIRMLIYVFTAKFIFVMCCDDTSMHTKMHVIPRMLWDKNGIASSMCYDVTYVFVLMVLTLHNDILELI